jgi:cell division initiation protein
MLKPEETPTTERHFKVTPLDLRQMRFKTVVRGYDRDEVAASLLEVADDYENALRDNDRLRQEVMRLDASLVQYRELEGSLKTMLMSAQKVADDIRETATQESARVVREAETRSQQLLQSTQTRVDELQREIDGLKLKRREAEHSIESTIATLRNTLEFIREHDQRDDKVVQHRPRVEIAAAG